MQDTARFKERLVAEEIELQKQLAEIGVRNPADKKDWVPTEDVSVAEADSNVVADHVESFNEHVAVTADLETRLLDVTAALEKIEKGAYGLCEVNGEPIEEARLEANPAARTCTEHMG